MEKTEDQTLKTLAWLRFVLNPDMTMPTINDWSALMAFAEKQALTGICLPGECPKNLSKGLNLLNKRIEQLFGILEQAGFHCCLLKGQGNAEMYPNPLRRCPGDIDVWVDADEKPVYQYVKRMFPDAEESYKHIHFPIFEDAPVDVHVTPLKFYSSFYGNRLQRWIGQNKEEQFAHKSRLTGIEREVSVPTAKFNAVYQLGHMLIHLFDEGIGLRQVVDYNLVLKNLKVSKNERDELVSTIKNLGMYRFARSMMWIESSVLGLPIELCIVEPDERRGKQLLEDILEGGNFGHYSQRYNGRNGFYYRGMLEAWRDLKLLPMAPREGTARLVSKLGTAVKHVFHLNCNES